MGTLVGPKMVPKQRPPQPPLIASWSEWIAIGLAIAAVFSFYYWTAATSDGLPPPGKGYYSDYYSLLVHGFLKGHLYLDVPTSPAMLAARDPYDPAVWNRLGWMADTSYFHGRYYLYFGVGPAVAFLLPYRLITGGDLWLGTAGTLIATLAFCSLAALWLRIRRDHFPRSGSVVAIGTLLALGGATGLLAILRRPYIYEVPIVTGCLFSTLMLHCLYSAAVSPRERRWMATAGLCLGLAVASRPPLLLAALAPVWTLGCLLRRGRRPGGHPALNIAAASGRLPRRWCGTALAFGLSFGVIFAGTLIYNYERFGNFLEFGIHYQLTDPPAAQRIMVSTSYFWFNLKLYYTAGLAWSRHFPLAGIIPPATWPRGYLLSEAVYGQLKYTPVIWFALACPLALGRRRGVEPGNLAMIVGVILLAYLGPGLFDPCFEASAIRYTVDFMPSLVLAAAIGALALVQVCRTSTGKNIVRSLWLMAAVVSAGVAAIVSIPLEGSLVLHRGNAYNERVARVLNLPAFWYEGARGWRYGPITWRLELISKPPGTVEKLAESPDSTLSVEYLADNRLRLGLSLDERGETLWSEVVGGEPGRVHTLSAAYGSLYPAADHPYYLREPYSALARSTIALSWDGRVILEGFDSLGPVDCRDLRVADGSPRPGWFSGRISAVGRDEFAVPDLRPHFAPAALRCAIPPYRNTERWPLISAGSPGRGDLLFLETESSRTARFGYYSAGSPLEFSPLLPLAAGATWEGTVQMEQLAPSGRTGGPARPLVIEQGGRILWLDTVAYHPCGPSQVRMGENQVVPAYGAPTWPGGIRLVETKRRLAPATTRDCLLLRVVFPTNPSWGLREPILTTGTPGASDSITVLHYGGGAGRFVLEHSGAPSREGPIIGQLDHQALHDIEIITPVFALDRGTRQPMRGTISVRMDNQEVLRYDAELYPAPLGATAVGAYGSGGSPDSRFAGAILSQRWVSPASDLSDPP